MEDGFKIKTKSKSKLIFSCKLCLEVKKCQNERVHEVHEVQEVKKGKKGIQNQSKKRKTKELRGRGLFT